MECVLDENLVGTPWGKIHQLVLGETSSGTDIVSRFVKKGNEVYFIAQTVNAEAGDFIESNVGPVSLHRMEKTKLDEIVKNITAAALAFPVEEVEETDSLN